MKWQYRVEKFKTGGIDTPNLDTVTGKTLDAFGADGWELIQVLELWVTVEGNSREQVYFYFKRPAP